ncbi:hypothetical protein IAQ67_29425 (plasmid) [Paenibacillus peoriae]|uniref:Uncharacterized protein n=1 Tax=Paenibacillus peoriae TaxID=59893 RepID=A0A7H0YHI3_9BACL|nr:hypothetical protein [Paenibacillus peoriae]QNR70541.1 hypothetical protein IAQ67_29425 [Paenibacillus peoriae]
MAKKSKLGQVQKLEEQIRELREKQKKIIELAQKEIGEYLMDSWEVEDIEQAKKLIDKFKQEAKASFNNSDAGNSQELNSNNTQNNYSASGSNSAN